MLHRGITTDYANTFILKNPLYTSEPYRIAPVFLLRAAFLSPQFPIWYLTSFKKYPAVMCRADLLHWDISHKNGKLSLYFHL